VAEHLAEVQLLDVREPDEFVGPLGHVPGAVLIPLGQLAGRAGELSKDKPIVAICKSGGRSAQAVNALRGAGFKDLANLPGGMLRWNQEGLEVER
jgi:rhodanese-related sulfurtransferase